MTSLGHFSVQAVAREDKAEKPDCIHVDALGPVQAAEIALGETLVHNGTQNRARAVVWHLAEDFSPVSVTLYSPA